MIKDYLTVESVGSTMDNLNTDIINRVPIGSPPSKEQACIVDYCTSVAQGLIEQVNKVQQAINKLKEYRTALITHAVTGKIDGAPCPCRMPLTRRLPMYKEANFEQAIAQELVAAGGYAQGDPAGYNAELALFPQEILDFVQRSQPKFWSWFSRLNQDKSAAVLLESLVKELESKGMLTVLRDGFKCFGRSVRAVYFAPNTGMNPEAAALYAQNRLTVTRQVVTASGAIPDVVLAVNGLPVATLELKNPLTHQEVENAKRQYRYERDPNELLFAYKRRCLVHFAVDPDLVYMTTQLEGARRLFLPFNRGHDQRRWQPAGYNDVRTGYLWQEVSTRDSLLDILARFLHRRWRRRTS